MSKCDTKTHLLVIQELLLKFLDALTLLVELIVLEHKSEQGMKM